MAKEIVEREMPIVCQVRVLKKALDESVSYRENARAPRDVLPPFCLSSNEFTRLFSIPIRQR